MKTIMVELGCEPALVVARIHTEFAVTKCCVATRGLGRMRHLDVKMLWLQECVQLGRLNVPRVSGATNVADVMAKCCDSQVLKAL